MDNFDTGFILIDIPENITSHDVVDKLRSITEIKKIGHSGTLDPMATGLLILGVGREATKKLSEISKKQKEYIANIKLGAVSDTYDADGNIKKVNYSKIPDKKDIKTAVENFTGEIKQIPPIFSAKKIKGKKAYQLARQGKDVKLKSVEVKVYKIEILKYKWPDLKIKVKCSCGTYIRSLANDIGEKLNCGGYLSELRRTKIGKFSVKKAVKLSDINPKNWKRHLTATCG